MINLFKSPEVSVLKESVRHNEKGIDRVERRVDALDKDLKDFRAEVHLPRGGEATENMH